MRTNSNKTVKDFIEDMLMNSDFKEQVEKSFKNEAPGILNKLTNLFVRDEEYYDYIDNNRKKLFVLYADIAMTMYFEKYTNSTTTEDQSLELAVLTPYIVKEVRQMDLYEMLIDHVTFLPRTQESQLIEI